MKIVHFLGSVKPWHHHFDEKSHKVVMLQSSNAANETFNLMWWELYREDIPVNASETQVRNIYSLFPSIPGNMAARKMS